ncbi:hypothetical protein GCM10010182_00760 [Actinomadura cremea]|nr:hypothetical protein GCM10010182_00760 [Actinomadura cremea]
MEFSEPLAPPAEESAGSAVPQTLVPTPDEVNSLPADRRLELLELQRQREDTERERRRQSKHQWFNSIGILIGVLAVIAGLITSFITWRIGQDQLSATREGQVTDRYAKAVEQLSSDEREVRTAAVFALERIGRDSPRDRRAITHVLAAYIRERDPEPKVQDDALPPEPDVDVASALTALGRLHKSLRTPFEVDPLALQKIRVPGARLRLASLYEADLSEANLHDVTLNSVDMRTAELTSAHLSSANLEKVDLRGANLSNANLNGATLIDTNARDAYLSSIDLSGANIFNVDFQGADLSFAYLSDASMSGWLGIADIKDALDYSKERNTDRVNLSRADLDMADLSEAYMPLAIAVGARFRSAKLRKANLLFADMRMADLIGADLSGAKLFKAKLSGADLSGADLSGADLSGADLSEADLSEANLSGATLKGIKGMTTAEVREIARTDATTRFS